MTFSGFNEQMFSGIWIYIWEPEIEDCSTVDPLQTE